MSFLEYFNFTALACAGTFVATLILSQKIKDVLMGVPSDLRASLNQIEAAVKADLQNYVNGIAMKLAPTPTAVLKPKE